jgi:ComF family protein
VAPLRYRGPARDLVLALKFGGRLPAAAPLGRMLADAVVAAGIPGDLVVPVPLSRARFRRRGHNQADEIARVVARLAGLERDPRALSRRRDGGPQSGKTRAARAKGPRGAYRADGDRVRGRCVLLVDDVVTTGATASACARALRRAGAARVVLAAACRA